MATSLVHRVTAGIFGVSIKRQLKELYLFSLFFSLAQGLVMIFEPIFLYQQGFSLSFIALYYALHYTVYIFVLPWGSRFAARFGLERSLAVSTPFFMLYILVLALLPWKQELWVVGILLLTTHKVFYWPAWHTDFAQFADSKKRGMELSWMNMLLYGVGILGPFIGGLVAATYGFTMLFIVTACTVLLASFTLLRTKEHEDHESFAYTAPWKIMATPKHKGMVLAMLGMGENLIQLVFWPIFMFIILGNTAQLGLIATIGAVIMTLFGFLVGELTDKKPDRTILRLHLPFFALSYLFLPLASTAWRATMTNIFSQMSYMGVHIPMLSRLYGSAMRSKPLAYITAFEMTLAIAKALTAWLLVFIFAFFLPYTGFSLAFLLAAALVFLYAFL